MSSAKQFLQFFVLVSLAFFFSPPFANAQKAAHAPVPSAQSQHNPVNGGYIHAASARGSSSLPSNYVSPQAHSSRRTINAYKWGPQTFANFHSPTPAPGPGFEFGFLNGANSGFGPVGRRRDGGGRNTGFGSGFYLLSPGGYSVAPEDDSAAPVADDQQQSDQPAIATPEQSQEREVLATEGAVEEPMQDAPVQDEGEFTLILRDGSRISALAFTHSSDKIIYISPDGGRRTFANADLDADATVRVNQERGTPLQLPL
jgi:hypothetical protein